MSQNLFQKIIFHNKSFIIMRDDLNHPIFSGNKARKLAYILEDTDSFNNIQKIVSFGGNQSNFMLALSQLAKLKNWQFEYWVKPLPKFLKQSKLGNLKHAINNGMILKETRDTLDLETIEKYYIENKNIYFFDQGGRTENAELGIKQCADEILEYTKENKLSEYSVVVASGTGTTALFLEKHIPKKIYTIACVGSNQYLKKQMDSINCSLEHPHILSKSFESNFGQLDIKNHQIHQELLKQTNIEFELLYDPIAWRVMLEEYDNLPKPIIYIHCGGTTGNETMIKRYQRGFSSIISKDI